VKFEIKSRFSGSVLFSVETDSWKLALEAAVKAKADLSRANLSRANLFGANLFGANLSGADLSGADLSGADLSGADLSGANLSRANLSRANLSGANLSRANLYGADLFGANLSRANLYGADLKETKNLFKTMGVEPGNIYWKRFERGLNNNNFQFHVGLNTLRDGEEFAADERTTCSYPGFHFASRSWCACFYANRPLEARIRIPEDAQINEPWTTDGKASADKIEILQVFEVSTGKDVTDQFRRKEPTNEVANPT
jgi:hypothetical protein